MVAVSGTISVARMMRKIVSRPRNCIRASGYAAISENSSVPPTCTTAIMRLLLKYRAKFASLHALT